MDAWKSCECGCGGEWKTSSLLERHGFVLRPNVIYGDDFRAGTPGRGWAPDDDALCHCGYDGWVHKQFDRKCPYRSGDYPHNQCFHLSARVGDAMLVNNVPSCGFCGVALTDFAPLS